MEEPKDIVDVSDIVETLRGETRIQRVYVPDAERADELRNILGEVER